MDETPKSVSHHFLPTSFLDQQDVIPVILLAILYVITLFYVFRGIQNVLHC